MGKSEYQSFGVVSARSQGSEARLLIVSTKEKKADENLKLPSPKIIHKN